MVEITTEISIRPAVAEDAAEIARVHVRKLAVYLCRHPARGDTPELIQTSTKPGGGARAWPVSPQSFRVCCGNRRGRVAGFAVPGRRATRRCPTGQRFTPFIFVTNFMASARAGSFLQAPWQQSGRRGPSVIVWCLG